jgi:hypothetical protein
LYRVDWHVHEVRLGRGSDSWTAMTTSKQFIDIGAGSGFAEDVPEGAGPVVELYDMAGVHGLVLWSVADLLVGHVQGSQPWPR